MNKAKLIESIKLQLKALVSSEVKFAEIKAGDMMITSPDEELVVGSEVFMVDADGMNVPLTDGEYTLDSGVKITVTGGKVDALINPEAEVEAETEVEIETPEEEVGGEVADEEVDTNTDELKKLMERVDMCEKMISEMMKEKTAMEQKLSAISAQPSTPSIAVEPTEFKSVEDKKSVNIDILSIREKARKNR